MISRLLIINIILACIMVFEPPCQADEAPSYMHKLLPEERIFEVCGGREGPVIKKGDPGTEDNKYGFEGGRAFKYKGEYHMMTAERFGDPIVIKMRLAHWKSPDGISWERLSTLYESSGNFTGEDPRASLWAPMPIYDESQEHWNLFYIAYRAKPNDPTGWYLGYEGKVWRAVSTVAGYDGLDGPYEDVGIILQPGPDSDEWEGLQGTDSFFPYKVGDEWYGFYGSAQTQKEINPKYPKWAVGLAKAPKLEGPWKRCSDLNPIRLHQNFTENPVVTMMKNGRYIAMVDGGPKAFGYSVSDAGILWSKATYIDLEEHLDKWWSYMRTPLGLIVEDDGTFTVFFTAITKSKFACLGMVKLKEINNNVETVASKQSIFDIF